jgi:predicted NodU family carbamoyl transferase
MKILSISFGFNGSMCLMDNGKIIRHISFNKINYGKDRDIIKDTTFSLFLEGSKYLMEDIDYFVFAGYDRSKLDYVDLDFVPEDFYRISNQSLYVNENLERRPVNKLMSLLPPFTESPYDYISGHFIFKKIVKPAFIISPDITYTSYGYFSSDFTRSLNITINSNDHTSYDGSLVSVSKSNDICVVQRPKISVGKLYPKITELLGFGLGSINNTTLQDISTRYHIPKKMENLIDKGIDNKLSDIKDNYELSVFYEHSTTNYYQDVQRHKSIPYSCFGPDNIHSKYVLKTAAITQRIIENTTIKLIEDTIKKYSGNTTYNVVLCGDLFENRRLNTKILNHFNNVTIHIAPYNRPETMSLGAALYVNSKVGNRRMYSRDFLLSTAPYSTEFKNMGEDIDYNLLSNELKKNLVSFNNGSPECTEKSMGYTGLLFDIDCESYEDKKDLLFKNPYEKPILLIKEDRFIDTFIDTKYTYDNNTLVKPKRPHIFKNFIHDDGYLNVFVINEKTNPYLYRILDETKNDYLGFYNFTDKENKHIILVKTIFEISFNLGINYMLIDNKQHIKKNE